MGDKIGTVTHFYDKISVAVVKLISNLALGDTITIKGKTSEFSQAVGSMQLDHVAIEKAKKGQEVAIKVDNPIKKGDEIFKAQ